MSGFLSKGQVEDLLDNVLEVTKRNGWKGDKIQFCCPIHKEEHPSCGINIDYRPTVNERYQVFHCFACNEGGSLPWLLFRAMPDKFKSLDSAIKFISERYNVSMEEALSFDESRFSSFEDQFNTPEDKRFRKDMLDLAVFKSGIATYKYFFNRGFDKEDMQKFMVGYDEESKTVTIPVFWDDNTLAGIIGRYVSKNAPKNNRYKIYDFPKGSLVFPLNHLKVEKDTIIVVEGMLDCMALHKWGFPNAVSIMTNGMSYSQADYIASHCSKVIGLFDNDEGGEKGHEIAQKRLKNRVMYLRPTYYPSSGKDPLEWGELETVKVINSASICGKHIPLL